MIYKNSWQIKAEQNQKWHKWFAWYPVNIGNKKKAWLETVERRWIFAPGVPRKFTEYRLSNKESE